MICATLLIAIAPAISSYSSARSDYQLAQQTLAETRIQLQQLGELQAAQRSARIELTALVDTPSPPTTSTGSGARWSVLLATQAAAFAASNWSRRTQGTGKTTTFRHSSQPNGVRERTVRRNTNSDPSEFRCPWPEVWNISNYYWQPARESETLAR